MQTLTFEQKLVRIEELVGRINPSTHAKVEAAFARDEAGVWRVAQNINKRVENFHNPAAAFMRAILDEAYITPKLAGGGSTMPTIPRYQPLPNPTPAQAAHFRTIGEDWKLIQKWISHPEVRELHAALQGSARSPGDPTDLEAKQARETLVFAIRELEVASA